MQRRTCKAALWATALGMAILQGGQSSPLRAQERVETSPDLEAGDVAADYWNWNAQSPTLGGRQFWGDVLFFRGYRIQQHVLSQHYRLLDPRDVRCAWGTREECQAELDQIKSKLQLPPMHGRAVILVHGIIRSSKCFGPLTQKLADDGYHVVGFDYPSTQAPLADSASFLRQTIESLHGIDQIDLVVHSMGGLLVRTYLQQAQAQRDPRLHRMVMLGVPNQGARMANLFQKNWIFQLAFGPAGQQLIEDPAGFIARLPSPDFEFAVIAGVRGHPDGWNPLIPGDDDGTVSVEATRLPGASDFIEIPSLHSSMMWNPSVMTATLNFLHSGALRDDGLRCPIPSAPAIEQLIPSSQTSASPAPDLP